MSCIHMPPHVPPRSINCYTAQDLRSGLQQLAASPPIDWHVTLFIWANMTLADVADRWPARGFQLPMSLSFVARPPGRVRTACLGAAGE